jgi:hypothetical protein
MPQSDVSSPANTPPILNAGYSEDDYRAMLSKIGKLQVESFDLIKCAQIGK